MNSAFVIFDSRFVRKEQKQQDKNFLSNEMPSITRDIECRWRQIKTETRATSKYLQPKIYYREWNSNELLIRLSATITVKEIV